MKAMRMILTSVFTFLFLLLSSVFVVRGVAVAKREWHEKTAVVFDLGGVLLTTSRWAVFNKQLGKLASGHYMLRNLTITGIKDNWFKALEAAAKQNAFAFQFTDPDGNAIQVKDDTGKVVPDYMVAWLAGEKSNREIYDEVCAGIDALADMSDDDKAFMKKMCFPFLTQDFAGFQLPIEIKQMRALLKKLKTRGYPLYILSNWDQESFFLVKDEYPELFELFDGYVISGEAQVVKPDQRIYEALEKEYPHAGYIFLDDQADNRKAARARGWKTVKVETGKPNTRNLLTSIQKLNKEIKGEAEAARA